jgi:hypothetical protein
MDITAMGFDADWLADHWWLMFPLFGFIMMFWSMWMQAHRSRDWMRLMRTYAEQGKEPPASLATPPGDSWGNAWGGRYDSSRRTGPYFDGRRAIVFAAIAAGCAFAYYRNPAANEAFLLVAVIVGALAIGYMLVSIIRPAPGSLPPAKPDDK